MPLIQVQLLEGCTTEQKEALIKETTEAAANTLNCERSKVRVLIHEFPLENWGIAGESVKKLQGRTSGS